MDKIIACTKKASFPDVKGLGQWYLSHDPKWLTGRHNFTTNTIARITLALETPIINVASYHYAQRTETIAMNVAEDK